ncbi:MAG: YkvA family protein [Kineosporiaceae bacterium]
MDLSTLEWLLLSVGGVLAVVGLGVVVLLVVVATRYRRLLPSALALVGALLYGVSPIDLVPEALVGPLGVLDDVGVLGAALAFFITQVRRKRAPDPGSDDPITVRQLPD